MELLHLEGGALPVPRVEVVMYSLATLIIFFLPRQLSPARRSARLFGAMMRTVARYFSPQAEHARLDCTRGYRLVPLQFWVHPRFVETGIKYRVHRIHRMCQWFLQGMRVGGMLCRDSTRASLNTVLFKAVIGETNSTDSLLILMK
jgi:hypothetical protein